MSLVGASAVVTGGSSGIGAATVRQLQAMGMRVAVLDVQDPVVDLTAQASSDTAQPPDLIVRCDVANEEHIAAAIRQVVDVFGGIDLAVLSAAVGGFSPIRKLNVAEWDRVHAVNVRGAAICIREIANAMVANGNRGSIVAVTSISATLAERGLAHYGSSKAALTQVVRIAARELAPNNIRVNAVAPGTTATPMFAATERNPGYQERVARHTALARIGTADDVAAAIVAIAQLKWVTGQTLVADGGVSLWSPIDPIG